MKQTLLILFILATLPELVAQDIAQPRLSPVAILSMRFKTTYVKISYGQPRKKGRVIFGGVVPFGKVWRTGANEATEITLTQDLQINNNLLKAGTYSIFTIPYQDHWTVILNGDTGLWGAYNYNSSMDVLRFDVPTTALKDVFETFTMNFVQRNDQADWEMMWDQTKITIPIKFIAP